MMGIITTFSGRSGFSTMSAHRNLHQYWSDTFLPLLGSVASTGQKSGSPGTCLTFRRGLKIRSVIPRPNASATTGALKVAIAPRATHAVSVRPRNVCRALTSIRPGSTARYRWSAPEPADNDLASSRPTALFLARLTIREGSHC